EKHEDIEKDLRDQWEKELTAAIEAEYRRRRSELLSTLQWWFRDIWISTVSPGSNLAQFPQLAGTGRVAARLNPELGRNNVDVMESLHRLLRTNVQESLALEVGLLKLHL